MKSPESKVILKADDYGNVGQAGPLELVRRGLLTDVAVMSNVMGNKDANMLQEAINSSPLRDMMGVLLHVNFQSGRPLSPLHEVSSLVGPDGQFKKPESTFSAWQKYSQEIKPEEAERELRAQITRFYELFGRLPDALDSHNVILAVSPLDEIAVKVAKELQIGITYPYLYTEEEGDVAFAPQQLHTELLARYKEEGIPTADHAFPTYVNSEPTFEDSVARMQDTLATLQPGVTQVVFHPVHADTEITPLVLTDSSRRDEARRRDFRILTEPGIEQTIVDFRAQGKLTSYKMLNQERRQLP